MAARLKKEDPMRNMNRRAQEFFYGGLAQLGEHLPCKQGVESSNLLVSICTLDHVCRTYLENRILKIQKTMKTSEASVGGAGSLRERLRRQMKKRK